MAEVQEKKSVDPTPELRRMVELVVTLPALGPPLASLAFKLGHKELGERVSAMGQGEGQIGVEYDFVRAQTARREKRFGDVLVVASEAIEKVAAASDEQRNDGEDNRLLHLVRLGFSVALFDLNDVKAANNMALAFVAAQPKLGLRLNNDGFYRSLVAQSLWFQDTQKSEAEWDLAVQCGNDESTWNARGTWYKDAEADKSKAEATYRKGLELMPDSALLLHNVAQLLVDRGFENKDDAKKARRCCNQADELLRRALRQDSRLRRHIHATRDRLFELRKQLPQDESRKGNSGRRPGPNPARPGRKDQRPTKLESKPDSRHQGRNQQPTGDAFSRSGKMSLGDMLLAKLENKSSDASPSDKKSDSGESS